MEVRSLCELRATAIEWKSARSGFAVTVIVKGTFDLLPTESRLADRQEDVTDEDNHWNDDPERSVFSPSDLAPFKVRADVIVVGHAFTPNREPARQSTARVVVGEVDKAVQIAADRAFSLEGEIIDGPRFTKMPLRYERAAGGPDTWNPVGLRADATDAYGRTPLPNLLPPTWMPGRRGELIEPIGFGPLAPTWPIRRDKLGRHAEGWSFARWQAALPDDIDPAFFNVAPRDQQLALLRDDERIVLENLHPRLSRLVTNLPGSRPRVFVEGGREIRMVCDTLWIDTDRSLATLTFRGQLAVEEPGRAGTTYVALEEKGRALGWADIEPLLNRAVVSTTARVAPREVDTFDVTEDGVQRKAPDSLPFVQGSSPPPNDEDFTRPGIALPTPAAPAWLGRETRKSPQTLLDPQMADVRPATPFQATTSATPFRAATSSAAPAPSIVPTSAGLSATPFQPSASYVPPAAPQFQPSTPAPAPLAAPYAAQPSYASPPLEAPPVVSHALQAALAGAAAASNAAATSPVDPPTEPPGGTSVAAAAARALLREYVDLLWFDKDAPKRIRATAAWSTYLADPPAEGEWLTGDEAFEDKKPVNDRRDLGRSLTRVPKSDVDGIGLVLGEAVNDEGVVAHPLVVVTGDLQLYFEEVEALKATVAVVSPLAAADKKLKDMVDAAAELLASDFKCTSSIAEGMATRLREAFGQVNRTLPATYVEQGVERILLEQRRYQKRTILGEPRLRCALFVNGATANAASVPAYLPESLEKELPMYQRFRVTLVAEARGQQDQYEASPYALVALALGRVLPMPGKR
jgi:hypothetical protein